MGHPVVLNTQETFNAAAMQENPLGFALRWCTYVPVKRGDIFCGEILLTVPVDAVFEDQGLGSTETGRGYTLQVPYSGSGVTRSLRRNKTDATLSSRLDTRQQLFARMKQREDFFIGNLSRLNHNNH